MSITERAQRELSAVGADEEFSSLVLQTMDQFFDRYDSGGAVSVALPMFVGVLQRLIAGQPLSPLTGNDDEWVEVGMEDGAPVYQNNRDSSVFKQKRNGVVECYDIDTPGRPAISFPYLATQADVASPVIMFGGPDA